MTQPAASIPGWEHDQILTVLARADAARLKALAEGMVADLGDIEVVENRTGLVMVPMRDTAKGTQFHLGEALVSEAHITAAGQVGYGMRRGRDLEAAMAMAVVDLAVAQGRGGGACRDFLDTEVATQRAEDRARLCAIEATRVDMETF